MTDIHIGWDMLKNGISKPAQSDAPQWMKGFRVRLVHEMTIPLIKMNNLY